MLSRESRSRGSAGAMLLNIDESKMNDADKRVIALSISRLWKSLARSVDGDALDGGNLSICSFLLRCSLVPSMPAATAGSQARGEQGRLASTSSWQRTLMLPGCCVAQPGGQTPATPIDWLTIEQHDEGETSGRAEATTTANCMDLGTACFETSSAHWSSIAMTALFGTQ